MTKITLFHTLLVAVLLITCASLYSQNWSKYDFADDLEFTEYVVMPEILLHKIMQKEEFILVDIRSEKDFNASHITGAVSYPWDSREFQKQSEQFPRDRDLYVISADGADGFDAVRLLLEKGFSRVYTIEGGVANWPYTKYLVR
jgi:rhodanese-related sulfurtransferase